LPEALVELVGRGPSGPGSGIDQRAGAPAALLRLLQCCLAFGDDLSGLLKLLSHAGEVVLEPGDLAVELI